MGAPGMKFIFLGLAILLVGFFFKQNLKDMGDGIFMGVEIFGAVVVLVGAFLFFKAKNSALVAGSDGHLQLRNEILLNTLAGFYLQANRPGAQAKSPPDAFSRGIRTQQSIPGAGDTCQAGEQ